MPISYDFDEITETVIMRVEGSFTLDEMLTGMDTVFADPRVKPGFALLSDHRGIGDPATSAQLRGMVDHASLSPGKLSGSRWAIVVSKPASHGMIRMLAVLVEELGVTVEIFKEVEPAMDWLHGGADSGGR